MKLNTVFTHLLPLFFCSLLLNSCATYHLSTQSLVQQLANTQTEKKINFIGVFPIFVPGVVKGNSLQYITVLDKNEKTHIIDVTRHTGIRVTKKTGKRKTFYFDTLMIKDSLITGKLDHFLGINIKPINLNNIAKIEIQK